MQHNNILITSAGKRVSLTKKFMKELKIVFPESKVYTTDMNPGMAPAGVVSDGCFGVPRCTSEDYMETLFSICMEYRVGVVVPTIDTELMLLAANKDLLEKHGIHIVV